MGSNIHKCLILKSNELWETILYVKGDLQRPGRTYGVSEASEALV